MEKEQKKEAKSSDKNKSVKRKRAASKQKEPKEKREKTSEEEGSESAEKPAPRSLLPPPTTLISDQILRYKDYLQTEEAAPIPEEEVKEPAEASVEAASILLPPPETMVSADFDKVDLPLSVMKEADDFINQAQDEMFNQSLEEAPSAKEEEPVALKMNCTTPPPLIVDREK